MLKMHPDACSAFWKMRPTRSVMDAGNAVAATLGIESPSSPTVGQSWAIAVHNSDVQFDLGYCHVLILLTGSTVGFLILQKRIWEEPAPGGQQTRRRRSTTTPSTTGESTYGHIGLNDLIPIGAKYIWPMFHIHNHHRQDRDGDHYESMSNSGRSSIFPIHPHSNGADGSRLNNEITVDVGVSKANTMQPKIKDFFAPEPGSKGRAKSSSSMADPRAIDKIKDCLQGGYLCSRGADSAIRVFFCSQFEQDKHESLRSIIKSLRGPPKIGSVSLEDVQQRVKRYVETLIAVSNAAAADKTMFKLWPRLQAALWWVLASIIPGSDSNIASKEMRHSWRESILSLLVDSMPQEGNVGVTAKQLEVAQAAECTATLQDNAPMEERAAECCFKCAARDGVWRCCHVEENGSQCQIGYCKQCMGLQDIACQPAPWYCRIHARKHGGFRPKFKSKFCWECPREDGEQECVECTGCGINLCLNHAVLSDQQFKRAASGGFSCPFCCGRRPLVSSLVKELRRLLTLCSTFPASKNVSLFTAKDVVRHMTEPKLKAVYDFSNLLFSAHIATLQEAAGEFIPALIELNLGMSKFPLSLGYGVPSSPSQLLRLLGGVDCPSLPGAPRILKLLSEAAARELVAQNNPSAQTDGARWARWSTTPALPADGRLSLALWLPFVGRPCPEVDILASVLVEAQKRGNFSRLVLLVRRLPGAKREEDSYDPNYGPCRKLIRHFSDRGAIIWFDEADDNEKIHSTLLGQKFNAIGSVSGYNDGNICSVFAKEPRAADLTFEMTAYPGFMYGIVDFTWSHPKLAHREQMLDPNRERGILNGGGPYACVGWHNGNDVPSAGDIAGLRYPEEGRNVLAFTGSLDKLSKGAVHMMCRILAGTGNGPGSAVLAVICSTDLGVDSVLSWIEEYNEGAGSDDSVDVSRLWIFPFRSKELFWSYLHGMRNRCLSIDTISHYGVHTTAGDALACGVPHLGIRSKDQMWHQNVASLLVEQVGLGQFLIANDVVDLAQKAVWWLLNPAMLQAASEHLGQMKEEQLGYFNEAQFVAEFEEGISAAFAEVVRVKGDRLKCEMSM